MAAEAALDKAATDFIAQGQLLGDPRESEGGFAFWPSLNGHLFVAEPGDPGGYRNKFTPGPDWIGGIAVGEGIKTTDAEIQNVTNQIYRAARIRMFALLAEFPPGDKNG